MYKLVEKYSAEHAKKLLPSLGLQIKDNSCQSTPDDNAISAEFTAQAVRNLKDFQAQNIRLPWPTRFFSIQKFKLCEKFNGQLDKMQTKLSENVGVVFEDGQCRPKTIIDYILEFILGQANSAAGHSLQASITQIGACLVLLTGLLL